jgi:uncharacterized membrane protein
MKLSRWISATVACLSAALAIPFQSAASDHSDHKPTYETFAAPFASTGPGYGTDPTDINTAGEIVGFYNNANTGEAYPFLRRPDGEIVTIDVPGNLGGVFGDGINSGGTIAGFAIDAGPDSTFVYYGFLRAPDGKIEQFDFPAGSGLTSTTPAINKAGAVTGTYGDANANQHGFLRGPRGAFTTIDVPGASGTNAYGINEDGTITGYDFVSDPITFSLLFHGYLRAPDGKITTFDVPGALDTFGYGINCEGTIAGAYYDANDVSHGFLRTRDGRFTTFDAPNASTAAFQGTGAFGVAINDAGVATGEYTDASNVMHGFVRDRDGAITTFDVPGAGNAFPVSINAAGTITGTYTDASGTIRGFVRKDDCDH